MCGIVGIISDKASLFVQDMTTAIAHRGPDDEGIFIEGNMAFGHRRLSILDLSYNGHQPMISDDGRFVIIFNGEIYNHMDIRREINGKYPFKSTSDTETLLYGFAEYGKELFNKLDGIFAFAIYDREKSEITIVRGPFGVKPLYYYHKGNDFLFGSEIKSLIKFADFDKTVDRDALANYIYFLWSPGENTSFKFCKKLLPGHYISIKTDEVSSFSINKYYDFPFTGQYSSKSEKDLIEELDSLLVKAVKNQMLSDVPVGFFLSGGLDSSLIVAIARKILPNKRITCYTIDTEIDSKAEGFKEDLPFAKKVAAYLGVDLEIVKADFEIVRDFDKMIYYLDEPQADAAPLNVSNICARARQQGNFVLLGGTGGDDLFSGYRRHQTIYYKNRLKILPYFIKRIILGLSGVLPQTALTRRVKKFFSIFRFSNEKIQLASLFGWLPEDNVRKLFKDGLVSFDPNSLLLDSLKNIPNEKSLLNQMLYWELMYFLPDHNLNYTDKMSMMHGVEVRVPYLDKDLVEFCAAIPPGLKMKGNNTKYILRKVAEKYLPLDVIYRPKTGFGAPVRDWINDDLRERIQSRLSGNEMGRFDLFNSAEVNKLIQDNKAGIVDASYSIWALLAIDSWLNQFIPEK
jgi:asparagine synthase (glutamine-hydrolysing)